ncbi:alpha/beta fold hydrolase [Actinoplanes nipponensis]|uniref:Alpha/beta hydrolase n=1 Tax=Actinoplanes nipponensis TaxID=135950 RepID=A0A919JFZ0_9ACTN|nr:alpha/beta hydrolase [Actinoplanes nipponensis]GIE48670.1 alpha/beta hydrolase [Actinoplanes nipponensis]
MSRTTSADGTPIAYELHGAAGAPAVIFVHGAIATRQLQPAPAAIAELTGLRVVEYDRRGRGESGDTLPYAVDREIEDIAALIEVVGGHGWLLGESSGATLALEAARAGQPVDGLLLYEPPIVADDGRPPVPADYTERLDALLAEGRRDAAFAQFSIEGVGLPPEMVGDVTASPYWPVVEPIAHTLAYDARVCGDTMSGSPAPLRRFAAVDTDATIVVGTQSLPYMRAGAHALAAALPKARVVELADAGHQVQAATLSPVLRETVGGTR